MRQRPWTIGQRRLRSYGGSSPSSLLTSLIAHWRMDEASGNAVDAHTNGLTLTDNNTVTSDTGKLGTSRVFTAANSEYFSRASETLLQTGDIDWTLAAWVYLTTTTGGEIASKWGGVAADKEFRLNYGPAGFAGAWHDNVSVSASNFGALSAATWYWVNLWHDATNSLLGISVNNVENTASDAAGPGTTGSGAFQLGRILTTFYANARLDSVSIWKRLLTAGEKTTIYKAGVGLDYPFA